MDSLGKGIIALGVVLIIIGGIIVLLQKIGFTKLPGDIFIQKGNFTFFFPIVTCIVISIILSIILNLLKR